jgi:RDD family
VSDCTSGGPEPLDLKLPADLHVTTVVRCTRSFLGIPHDWSLTVGEVARPEPSPTVRRYRTWSITFGSVFGPGSSPKLEQSRTVPLDPAGHITKAYYLDAWTALVLAAYLLLLEWRFGFTIGKRMLDLRVRALGGGPLTFAQASKRVGMRKVPFLIPSALVYKMPVPFEATNFQPVTIDVDLAGASGLVMIVFLVNFIRAVPRKELPWHRVPRSSG